MATHQNRNRLLLATVGLVVVGAILAGVVIQSRPETNDQAAESVTSTTSLSGSTTPSMAPTTPSVSSNGPIPPEQVTVQPEVQVTIDAGDIAPVILKLAVTPVGTDEERIEQVRAARNELLAQLPAGSWTGTDNVGTLPYIALSLDAAGFEATRNSGVVSMINDDEQLFVSASSLEPSSTVSPSSLNSTATMGATAAWAAGWKGAGSTVAVIDTGVQTDHPYLMRGSTKKTIAEACFSSSCPPGAVMSPTSNPIVGAAKPCSGTAGCEHGTHVAGIAVGGNGSSIPSGIAPEANLIAINVFYEYRVGLVPKISSSTSSIDNALSWLYNKRDLFPGLVSVNLSVGGSTKYTNYCDNSNSSTKAFIDLLLTVGITTVIASGNDRWADGVSAPGCISTAVTVGAVDGVPDVTTYYSNDGPQVDLMAPGSNITSSILGSQMGSLSGTSMATPAVAGAFAVLHLATPALTLARLRATGYVVNASGYSIPSVRLFDAVSVTVPPAGSSTFNPVSPVRLSDTRAQIAGGATVDSQQVGKGKLGSGGVSVIPIAGRGGVPQTGAGAVALNVTVISPSVGGYLTAYPSGSPRPNASNINFVAGAIVPNMVIAKLGTDGSIAVFNSEGSVDVAIDVVGWFPVSAGYGPLDPARIVETRSVPGYTTIDGQLQGIGAIGAGQTLSVPVAGRGSVPSTGVSAVALNVTAVDAGAESYLTVFPGGASKPNASNLNVLGGQTIANMVIAKVGADGSISIYNNSGFVNVVVDVMGWFSSTSQMTSLSPARLVESRGGLTTIDGRQQNIGPIGSRGTLSFEVAGRGGVPATGARAVVLNVTVVSSTGSGYLTAFASGSVASGASNLNFVPGQIVPNMVIAELGPDGKVSLFNSNGSTPVVVDVVGWFPS